jgi:hypothetical protein
MVEAIDFRTSTWWEMEGQASEAMRSFPCLLRVPELAHSPGGREKHLDGSKGFLRQEESHLEWGMDSSLRPLAEALAPSPDPSSLSRKVHRSRKWLSDLDGTFPALVQEILLFPLGDALLGAGAPALYSTFSSWLTYTTFAFCPPTPPQGP